MTFLQPRDHRWQGPQRWYLVVDLVKNFVLIAFCILITVETSLYRIWYNNYYSTVEYDSNATAADFFIRIGIALIPDILATLLTSILIPRCRFHPVYALTQSLILFSLYLNCLTFNAILVYSNESWITSKNSWYRMCYAEMALQGVLMLCWLGMVGMSCVAVHQWRGKKAEARLRNAVKEGLELKNVEDGRKDSANVDVERDGLVDGLVKSSRVFI